MNGITQWWPNEYVVLLTHAGSPAPALSSLLEEQLGICGSSGSGLNYARQFDFMRLRWRVALATRSWPRGRFLFDTIVSSDAHASLDLPCASTLRVLVCLQRPEGALQDLLSSGCAISPQGAADLYCAGAESIAAASRSLGEKALVFPAEFALEETNALLAAVCAHLGLDRTSKFVARRRALEPASGCNSRMVHERRSGETLHAIEPSIMSRCCDTYHYAMVELSQWCRSIGLAGRCEGPAAAADPARRVRRTLQAKSSSRGKDAASGDLRRSARAGGAMSCRLWSLLLMVSAGVYAHVAAPAPANIARPAYPLERTVGEERAVMTAAPNVPPPITRRHATKVLLDIEVREHTQMLSDGVSYTYWTFGENTPGNFIRVREGDLIETRLSNHPDNSVAHNIDFHAATGPGGGGEASFVAPGHSVTFSWRAMMPGLYLYHCVAPPAGLHITNGMYGLMLVEPKEGMPKVDREYFLVQGEFYTDAPFGAPGHRSISLEKALKEQPDYVVFNGHVGALMGDGALRAQVGESVRLYLGNAGPALLSSFHIVGEIFDNVYGEGGLRVTQHNVQSTIVPVGGSAAVEFMADVAGSYTFVDHSMFRAFNKGAMGTLEISGPARSDIFSGKSSESVYNPGTRLQRSADAVPSSAAPTFDGALATATREHGKKVYSTVCATCHQPDGEGLPGAFPPLAHSDFLMSDTQRSVRVLLQGLSGPITVNGKEYRGVMPKLPLSDHDIAAVLSYVRTAFGNTGSVVTPEEVERIRASLEGVSKPSEQVAIDRP